jgi:hypothetical protein
MKWIGHTEFGPNYIPIHDKNLNFKNDLDINHWLEQWFLTYQDCYEKLKNKKNIYFVCYEQLCYSKDCWLDLLKLLKIKNEYDFKFKESHKKNLIETDHHFKEKGLTLYFELLQLKSTI